MGHPLIICISSSWTRRLRSRIHEVATHVARPCMVSQSISAAQNAQSEVTHHNSPQQHHEFAESPERQCSRRFATAARTIALTDHIRHSHHVITAALSTISLHKNKHSRATRLSCTTHAQPTMGARQTECGQHQASGHHTFRRKTNDATSNQQEVSLLGAHCNRGLSIRNGERSAECPTQSRVEPRPSSNISYAHEMHNHHTPHAE